MRVRFDRFELDLEQSELRRDGVPVPVEPRVFDVLAYLIDRQGLLATKEDLVDSIWGDRFVSESAVTTAIKNARQALGDDGRHQRYIQTVHGRGYRFSEEPSLTTVLLQSDRPPNNLPAERTTLHGRDAEIENVTELVGSHRLTTLLGLGGVGKTRLAIAVGRALRDDFSDGIGFVDLAPLDARRSVVAAIADAASLELATVSVDGLAAELRDRDLLLILDNCEHIREEVAAVIDHLLAGTNGPRFLATSREPLNLLDEHRVAVSRLNGAASDAGRQILFETGVRVGAIDLDEDDAALDRICEKLDGIPLALELAGAQLRLLTPSELDSRLDRRFRLLQTTATNRDRHTSLHRVLLDTWEALTASEAELVTGLAVFPSGFSIEAVEGVVGSDDPMAVLDRLRSLIDHSLVTASGTTQREYRMLETVRLFAREQRPEGFVEGQLRHADWLLRHVGDQRSAHVLDIDLANWCAEHYNDLLAAEHALQDVGRLDDAVELAVAQTLAMHTDVGARASVAIQRADDYLSEPDLSDRSRQGLHLLAVMASLAARDYGAMFNHGQQGLALAETVQDETHLAYALVLASWTVALGEPERAIEMAAKARVIAADYGDHGAEQFAASYQAYHLATGRQFEEALILADEILAEDADPGRSYPRRSAGVLVATLVAPDEPDRARALMQSAGDGANGSSFILSNRIVRMTAEISAGDLTTAVDELDGILTRCEQRGRNPYPDLLIPFVFAAAKYGEPDLALRLIRSIRASETMTQGIPATLLYRAARRRIQPKPSAAGGEPVDTDPDAASELGPVVIAWLRGLAAET